MEATKYSSVYMGRVKRGGYLIEWWMGDHLSKHVHIYQDKKLVAKIHIPQLVILQGKMNKKMEKILLELLKEKRL